MMAKSKPKVRLAWAAEWHSRNLLDGDQRYLIGVPVPPYVKLFRTRRECQKWIETNYGYIRNRPDLRAEPYGWRMPRPVRVVTTVRILARRKQGAR